MACISLIAVIDENRGLGKNNTLLCHLPEDLKRFKALTLGKPVLMGRNTYNSIGKPLSGRLNVVLSHQALLLDGVEVVDSLPKALALVADAPEIMIIGGATLYSQALPLASRIYLTCIHHQFDADVFFPVIPEANWFCKEAIFQHCSRTGYDLTFYHYEKKLV